MLPYSFHSNFYCTLNARELIRIICSIRYGRGQTVPKLNDLADQIVAQIGDIFSSLLPEVERPSFKNYDDPGLSDSVKLDSLPCYVEAQDAGAVKLIGAPSNPLDIIHTAFRVSVSNPEQTFSMEKLLASSRPRELEQLTYSFLISDITLSGITHLVRHRMQSITVPPIQNVEHSRYIVPNSIETCSDAWKVYRSALDTTHDMLQIVASDSQLRKYGFYFAVSGNMMNVMTTANARELKLFIQLRTCSRAQWEIREIAISMLRQLREHCAELYRHFGPSCYMLGYCPEGKLTCGKMNEVCFNFKQEQ